MNSTIIGGHMPTCRLPSHRRLTARFSSNAAFVNRSPAGCRQPAQLSDTPQMSGQQRQQQHAAVHRRPQVATQAAAETIPTGETDVAEGDTYEVNIEKPMGIRFARGNDGAAYVLKSDPRAGNTDDRVEPGDKLLAVSASFGPDVWEAKNFGQVMYAVRTRNGGLYFKLLKRDGDLSIFEEKELSDAQKRFQMEKAGGNYGTGTKEMQERNYVRRKEEEKERERLFEGALKKFNAKDIEGALIDFENVLAMEPKNYVGDNFSRITDIYRVTQYNIACCYAAQGSVDAGLEALSDALRSGFDQYKVVREDKNLDQLRSDPRFTKLIDEYDEPVFNSGALKALRSIFGGNK